MPASQCRGKPAVEAMSRAASMAADSGDSVAVRTLGAVIKEKDEELALFLEMRRREKERAHLHHDNLLDDDDDLIVVSNHPGGKQHRHEETAAVFKIVPVSGGGGPRRALSGADDFLNSEGDKNDYDWLLTPPGTPLFPSLEAEAKRSPVSQVGTPKTRPTALKSRLANNPNPSARGTVPLRTLSSTSLNSAAATHRPSSSGGPTPTSSRPATPTGRPTSNATSKAFRSSTPTSRPTVPVKATAPPARSSAPSARSATPSSRSSVISAKSSTPANRSSAPATRSSTPVRSSTPSSRASIPAARSTTPSSRPSIPAQSKPASRSTTPTRRHSAPSSQPGNTAPPVRYSSVTKSVPTLSRSSAPGAPPSRGSSPAPPPSRGCSPTVRSRPWKPSEMPGFSLDAPPNLRTTLPERPLSATRGRPGAPSSRSSSVESGPNARARRQSCSPSRGRAPNSTVPTGTSVPASRRAQVNGGDSVNPVQMGNKMVERVVNMRRLVPPKQDDHRLNQNNLSGKSSLSPDGAGFGRSLSKKSLDMALRHMDIRRSIPNNLRPLMTNIPASSVYSVRSGSTRSRQVSVLDSPLATSSNASSEPSVNNIMTCFDRTEIEDDFSSEKASISSPAGQLGR